MSDLLQDLRAVLQVRLYELTRHIVIQVIKMRCNGTAGFQIEARTQLRDDRDGCLDQVILRSRIQADRVDETSARLAKARARAVRQHQDEAMRVGGPNPTVGRDALVRGEGRPAQICVHGPVAARSAGTLGSVKRG